MDMKSSSLMEVDLDINKRFIADCQAEAQASRDRAKQDSADRAVKQSQAKIREAESDKVRMFDEPG